jgi:hypothetical protein
MDRRLLDKLVRELARSETQAIEHGPREARRIGDVPPVAALRAVADHARAMRPRFIAMVGAHDLEIRRHALATTLAGLRHFVVGDPERAFRSALLDLRHGIDVVRLTRETARHDMLFGLIRWCDDWLGARRTLVARVEAQLAWYAERELVVEEFETVTRAGDDDGWHVDRTTDDRHEQERCTAGTSTGDPATRGDEVPTAKS